jgi:carboxypeptidase T
MKKSSLWLWTLGLLWNPWVTAHPRVQNVETLPTHIIKVEASTREQRTQIAELGYAFEEIRSDAVYVLGNRHDKKLIEAAGFRVSGSDFDPNWLKFSPQAATQTRYTSYSAMTQKLEQLANAKPEIATLTAMGRSLEFRSVPMIRISGKSPAEAESLKLPVALYTGCHHAREHLSVEVPLMFAEYLINEYGKNPDVTRLVDSREIYIVPIVNPDGHVHDYGDGVRGKMWRKNRRRNADGTFGVDLNRNYGFMWGTGGSSNQPGSDTYMGVQPFSEPETQNLKAFVDSQPRMSVLLSFHTFSELVLYPWGHTYDAVGDKVGSKDDRRIFETMAQTMARWNGYTPQQSSDLYIASGDTTDWAYGVHGIYAFTFELTPKSMWDGGFYPDASVIRPSFDANLKPMMYLLEYADQPGRVLTERRPSFLETPAARGIAVASFQDLLH